MTKPLRILIVSSHPVQYAIPVYRRFTQDPRTEVTVAFCTMASAGATFDADFGVQVAWDIPMLEGYDHIALRNRALHPTPNAMLGMINPGVWKVIRSGRFDLVVSPGYRGVTFWIAFLAARSKGIPFAWSTDAYGFTTHLTPAWLKRAKGFLLPRIYGLADMVFCMSSRGVRFFEGLRMRRPAVHLVPYVVDNDFFAAGAAASDRAATRSEWGVGDDAPIALCCGKLVPWKRPGDVLEAAARTEKTVLVFAGDGELRPELERRAEELGMTERVRFLGFVNQSGLPAVYAAADVLVLPSSYDAFGLVVNEAMACGRPAIVSDGVGCGEDLVVEGETGWTFPVGDVAALSALLTQIEDPALAARMGEGARRRMQTWGPQDHVDATVDACLAAIARRRKRR